MPRSLDTARYIILYTKFLLLLCPELVVSFPSQSTFFGDSPQDIFYDSNILPDSQEVSSYLLFNKTEKIFFVQDRNTPFYITIKPCASAVEWTVTHKSISQHSSDTHDSSPEDSLPPVKVLHKYSGPESHTFKEITGETGLFTIDITPLESDTFVKFYGTTKPLLKGIYPLLPDDNKVKIKKRSRKSISVEWKSSPEETPFDNIIEYHVSVNRKRSFDTYCSLMSHLKGDKFPKPPPNSGYGFSSEEEERKRKRQMAKPIPPAKKGEIFFTKLGTKTKFTFNRGRPNRKYYINVFAFNRKTNSSSAYKGVVVRTKRNKGKKLKRIKNGRVYAYFFKKSKESQKMSYKLTKPTKEVFFAVHSCSGKVRVQIRTKRKKILSARVQGLKVFTLKGLKKDIYSVKITNSRKGNREVRFTMSSSKLKYRYPVLPNDTRLTFTNTTSENVTIAWMGETNKQQFCIYKTEIPASVRKRKKSRYIDHCSNELEKNSVLVFCKRFKNHNQLLLRETITGLKSNQTYRIDVTVKRNGRPKYKLRYDSLFIKTGSV